MKYFIDFAEASLNKFGEELCGDKVTFSNDENSFIAVLSDGLGSGVKANILATLTAKIAITMLKEGLSIEEVVDTLVHTLPICSVRKLAYSTFTIIKVSNKGSAYIAEFDNPGIFFLREGKIMDFEKKIKEVNGRPLYESHIHMQEKDTLVFVSDGVIHAGVGMVLNLGWSWREVATYLETLNVQTLSANKVTNALLGVCEDLYMEKPGDDTTVATMQVIFPKVATLFSGPPRDPENDSVVVKELMGSPGRKIVCGGTAANVVAKQLGTKVTTSFETSDPNIPPIGHITGIDLVTEGVLTLQAAVEKLEKLRITKKTEALHTEDGAAKLARLLYEECTHIHMLIGRAINPAHQNPDFPNALSIKLNILKKLELVLIQLGKIVTIDYY